MIQLELEETSYRAVILDDQNASSRFHHAPRFSPYILPTIAPVALHSPTRAKTRANPILETASKISV